MSFPWLPHLECLTNPHTLKLTPVSGPLVLPVPTHISQACRALFPSPLRLSSRGRDGFPTPHCYCLPCGSISFPSQLLTWPSMSYSFFFPLLEKKLPRILLPKAGFCLSSVPGKSQPEPSPLLSITDTQRYRLPTSTAAQLGTSHPGTKPECLEAKPA